MKALLDTNALLWQLGLSEDEKLGQQARKLIQSAEAVYVSAISIVEMQIKTMIGKLDVPLDCVAMIKEAGNELVAFSGQAADRMRNFPSLVRHDPFDRMLLAQAYAENFTFLTADDTLLALKLPYVIDARI